MLPAPATVFLDLNPGTEAKLALLKLELAVLAELLLAHGSGVGRNLCLFMQSVSECCVSIRHSCKYVRLPVDGNRLDGR